MVKAEAKIEEHHSRWEIGWTFWSNFIWNSDRFILVFLNSGASKCRDHPHPHPPTSLVWLYSLLGSLSPIVKRFESCCSSGQTNLSHEVKDYIALVTECG